MILIIAGNHRKFQEYISVFRGGAFRYLSDESILRGARYSEVRLVRSWWKNPNLDQKTGLQVSNLFAVIAQCCNVNQADDLFPDPEPPETQMEFSL